jgi:hypothetical protein
MARKDQTGTALAVDEKKALATTQSDELAGVLGEDDLGGVTGLEEADASDIKLASLVFNFGGLDAKGDQIPKNRFFNTVDETVKDHVRVALLVLHKSRAWTEFVQGEGTQRRCTSWDNVTGKTQEGTERPCSGCPDYEWRTIEGKRTRRCTDVHNVVAVERETNQPVMIRFKKTSLDPWKSHLNKHFLGRRIVAGKRQNYPLFAFETVISLKLEKNGANAFAVPVLERGEVLSADEIRAHAESAKVFREVYLDREVRAVAERDPSDESAPPDTSFNPDEFADPSKGVGGNAQQFG